MSALAEERFTALEPPNLESSRSGVSWGAVFAGGVAAAGLSLILLLLGSGLGLASASPFAGASMTAAGLAVGAAIWLVIVQWLASLVGGYMAGRLRTKWAAHHTDEVFFRDTAHGLLAWAVATFIAIAVASSGLMTAVGAVAGLGAAAGVAAETSAGASDSYLVDQLFRRGTSAPAAATDEPPAASGTTAPAPSGTTTSGSAATTAPTTNAEVESLSDSRDEAGPILTRSILGTGTDADRTYLAQTISERTGLTQAEAEQRLDEIVATAKQAADDARKATATAAIMTALSLLVGAFIAAVAGALGGRYRDELSTIDLR